MTTQLHSEPLSEERKEQCRRMTLRLKVPGFQERWEYKYTCAVQHGMGKHVDVEKMSTEVLKELGMADPVKAENGRVETTEHSDKHADTGHPAALNKMLFGSISRLNKSARVLYEQKCEANGVTNPTSWDNLPTEAKVTGLKAAIEVISAYMGME